MTGDLVEELLQAKSPLLDELRLKDPVVTVEEGELLGEGLAWYGRHHDLHGAGQLVSKPLSLSLLLLLLLLSLLVSPTDLEV